MVSEENDPCRKTGAEQSLFRICHSRFIYEQSVEQAVTDDFTLDHGIFQERCMSSRKNDAFAVTVPVDFAVNSGNADPVFLRDVARDVFRDAPAAQIRQIRNSAADVVDRRVRGCRNQDTLSLIPAEGADNSFKDMGFACARRSLNQDAAVSGMNRCAPCKCLCSIQLRRNVECFVRKLECGFCGSENHAGDTLRLTRFDFFPHLPELLKIKLRGTSLESSRISRRLFQQFLSDVSAEASDDLFAVIVIDFEYTCRRSGRCCENIQKIVLADRDIFGRLQADELQIAVAPDCLRTGERESEAAFKFQHQRGGFLKEFHSSFDSPRRICMELPDRIQQNFIKASAFFFLRVTAEQRQEQLISKFVERVVGKDLFHLGVNLVQRQLPESGHNARRVESRRLGEQGGKIFAFHLFYVGVSGCRKPFLCSLIQQIIKFRCVFVGRIFRRKLFHRKTSVDEAEQRKHTTVTAGNLKRRTVVWFAPEKFTDQFLFFRQFEPVPGKRKRCIFQ